MLIKAIIIALASFMAGTLSHDWALAKLFGKNYLDDLKRYKK